MALEHAPHLHNTIPRYDSSITEPVQEGFSLMGVFSGTNDPYKDERIHPICWSRVWVFPTYVLYPVLCDYGNIPNWYSISRKGVIVGLSPKHAIIVGNIL